ncbi:MAG: lipid A deacylase LpxR family protein [Rhodobacterales bacterium]|nr:lipid A deacylase LpxR family protein [Rhodobacterales bacterium]MDX5391449.1 lipid A deacylase LpxR family protein [Rhodobacterales bacterium]MDX5491149.1 lipid A deacylase LpxR family protein [Rhodobacterales bacterium]
MFRVLTAICIALMALPQESAAQTRDRIGYGRLITNDYIGDGRDRWRSGSVASSRVWGRGWSGALPYDFGDILELRLGAQIIAPENLVSPAPGDRPYAGALSLGLHTHFERAGLELALGSDLVMTGPQTRLDDLQASFHDLVGVEKASSLTRASQVGNDIHLGLVGEAGREVAIGPNARMRPFIEARAGVETLLRAGIDVTFGDLGQGELLVRDPVTGQRYRSVKGDAGGYAFVMGGDIAAVSDSVYLPSSSGVAVRDRRTRLRAGLHWQGERTALFYGLTWLGKEFEGQDEGQVLGSIRLDLNF